MKNLFNNLSMVLVLFLTGCTAEKQEKTGSSPVGIKTIEISLVNRVLSISASGKLEAKTASKLSFKTGGVIQDILVDEGQLARKGQLLAKLDMVEIRSHVRQASLAEEKARRDLRRVSNLHADSVATLEQLENARTALEMASANVRIASFNEKHASITAPSDGKILKRIAEEAEIVAPGSPVFLYASTHSDWVVRTSVSDRDIVRIRLLDTTHVWFDAYPDRVFRGLISEIGTAADPYTGTFEVEVQLRSPPEKLVSGLIAGIDIFPGDTESRVWIPAEAVVEGSGLDAVVYVLEGRKHLRRNIRIERITDEGLMLSGGLSPGEVLITHGVEYLRPDSKLEILVD